jgi:uncharacterized membrane protein YGL010W
MAENGKLMDMLTGYASAHQHPFNIFVHMIGIPTIMFGVLIPLTWVATDVGGVIINLAHIAMLGFFAFYMTLDKLFAVVFLVFAMLIAWLAGEVGALPIATSGAIAAAAFFGGYAAQFLGHAVERSMPVLVKHPLQANLAAPFFTVVEMFKLLGFRDDLFNEVQQQISQRRTAGVSAD